MAESTDHSLYYNLREIVESSLKAGNDKGPYEPHQSRRLSPPSPEIKHLRHFVSGLYPPALKLFFRCFEPVLV